MAVLQFGRPSHDELHAKMRAQLAKLPEPYRSQGLAGFAQLASLHSLFPAAIERESRGLMVLQAEYTRDDLQGRSISVRGGGMWRKRWMAVSTITRSSAS